MARRSLLAATAMLVALGGATAVNAAVVLQDTYVGGNDHGFGDLIGSTEYQVTKASASRSGNFLTVTITTNYNANDAGLTNFGDLFITTNWAPKGSAADGYKADTFDYVNGTQWQFAIRANGLSGPTNSDVNGLATVFVIDQASDVKLSYVNAASGYTWRDGQPVQASSTATLLPGQVAGANTWIFDADPSGNNNTLSYTFDASAMGLLIGSDQWDMAIAWAMICANDVIQGDISQVPEPGSLLLLLGGLASLAGFRRRKHA